MCVWTRAPACALFASIHRYICVETLVKKFTEAETHTLVLLRAHVYKKAGTEECIATLTLPHAAADHAESTVNDMF